MYLAVLFISIYNSLFIPFQFAFRTQFKGIYLAIEVLTIILYAADIIFRVGNLRMMSKLEDNLFQSFNSDNEIEDGLLTDKDQFMKRVRVIQMEIACSAIAIIPFSLIF